MAWLAHCDSLSWLNLCVVDVETYFLTPCSQGAWFDEFTARGSTSSRRGKAIGSANRGRSLIKMKTFPFAWNKPRVVGTLLESSDLWLLICQPTVLWCFLILPTKMWERPSLHAPVGAVIKPAHLTTNFRVPTAARDRSNFGRYSSSHSPWEQGLSLAFSFRQSTFKLNALESKKVLLHVY